MEAGKIKEKFVELYKKEPLLVRSPGRVNLIGEHTDYNEGFVLPASIDKEVVCALAKNETDQCRFYAFDLIEDHTIDLNDLQKSEKGWPDYLMGVIEQVQKSGYPIQGFDCVIGGDIPLGAGLSSSAAIECAMIFGINELFQLNIDRLSMVKMAQMAENEFVGVKCGIMDQFASMFGQPESVIKLDCRTLEYEHFYFDMSDYIIVLCDTNVKHSLASSEYNTRRKECEKGVAAIQKSYPEVKSLRDVSLGMLEECRNRIEPVVFQRCRYVIDENARLHAACEDLQSKDMQSFGKRMYQSHYGLRDDYQVSCKELDFLVEQTEQDENVLGSRMMGGGFGGCTINLIKKDYLDTFIQKMTRAYEEGMNMELKVYVATIANGSSRID